MAARRRKASLRRQRTIFRDYPVYVPVGAQRARTLLERSRLVKAGADLQPVVIARGGVKIAHTFWGGAWCKNLESYSDFANRLPRGRTYVRNGSVADLKIQSGRIEALVVGSELYRVRIEIAPVAKERWAALAQSCTGRIDSVVELLDGRLSSSVMATVTEPASGLFPAPHELKLACSCPDWAQMCKHVAATLYGVGARLDQAPEKLFELRGVDHRDLISEAGRSGALGRLDPADTADVLESGDLADIFGIDLDDATAVSTTGLQTDPKAGRPATSARRPRSKSARSVRTTTAKKSTAKKSTAKKSTAKKATAKKATAKKATAKKSTAKKATAKKATAKKSTRRR